MERAAHILELIDEKWPTSAHSLDETLFVTGKT